MTRPGVTTKTKALTAEERQRRLANIVDFWKAKYATCGSAADFLRLSLDRAKAAAKASARGGGDVNGALYDLAKAINEWAVAQERRNAL